VQQLTRCLCSQHAQAQAELARQARDARVAEVEAENEALKQALQRLEAAAAALQGSGGEAAGGAAGQGGASPGAAAAGSMRVAQLEGEANVLRRKVAELQKGMDRLQQVRGACQGGQPQPMQCPSCDRGGAWTVAVLNHWHPHHAPRAFCLALPHPLQVFNKQITLFREAVYLLFGYRVEMASDPGVSLMEVAGRAGQERASMVWA
jgi:hypothetical protein